MNATSRTRTIEISRYLLPSLAGVAFLAISWTALTQGPSQQLFTALMGLVLLVAVIPARPRMGAEFLRPIRVFIPIFVIYNVTGVLLAGTGTTNLQLSLVIASALLYCAGTIVGVQDRRTNTAAPAPVRIGAHLSLPQLYACFVVGALPMLYLIGTRGIPLLSSNINAARVAFYPSGLFATGIVMPLYTAVILGAVTWNEHQGRRGKRHALIIVVASLLLLAVPGARGTVLLPLLVAAIYVAWTRKIRLRFVVIALLVVFAVFSYLGYQRGARAYGSAYQVQLAAEGYTGPFRYMESGLQYVAGTSKVFDLTIRTIPSEVPHPDGAEFFAPLLHKPSVDLYLKHLFGYNFTGRGLALGAMNAFYLDWGVQGIIAGFLIFGWVSGFLYQRARRLGGLWVLGYAFWVENLILSNYGHPFAYITYVILPVFALGLLHLSRSHERRRASRHDQSRTERKPALAAP